VEFPTGSENSIIQRLVQRQVVELTELQQNSTVIRAATDVIRQQATQEIVKVNAEAQSRATVLLNEARARSISLVLNATSQSLLALRGTLALSNAELLQMLYFDLIRTAGNATRVAIDLPSAFVGV
jgi:hypothetical protein